MQFAASPRWQPTLMLCLLVSLAASRSLVGSRSLTAETEPGYLGIAVVDLDPERAREINLEIGRGGIEITFVMAASPAAKAGLLTGDIVLSYNGVDVTSGEQFRQLVEQTAPGHKAVLRFVRDRKLLSATIVTIKRPLPETAELPRVFPGLPPEIPEPLLVWRNTILGVECESLNAQMAGFFAVQHGILVRFVEKNSRGDVAGLHAGDVIVEAGQHPVSRPRDLVDILEAGVGSNVKVWVMRDHKRMAVQVDVGE